MLFRSFRVPNPGAERDFLQELNPDSKKTIQAQLEPALRDAKAGESFQFERHGYFCVDARDSTPARLVFNRAVGLRDTWAKIEKASS